MSDDPWAILAHYAALNPIRVEHRPGLVQQWRATVDVDRGGRLADGRLNIWTSVGVGVTLLAALHDLAHFLPPVDGAED